ncbi:DNA polymerase III subunit beta [Candidatus Falkowbacteria bacterium]|nr:DNA polymerase III subunit beta [Candidatus Falkowbacteria bacterium]
MKFSCLKENLNKGLKIVSRVASGNTSLPILNNVLLEAKNETLSLVTTNLEIGVQSLIRGKIEEEGKVTVPASLLANYISFLPNKQVNVVVEGSTLVVSCERQKTKIKGIEATDFPIIPKIEKNKGFVCKKSDLSRAIGQVLFTVVPNETRPEISGGLLAFGALNGGSKPEDKNKLFLVGTDSYRLAEKKIDFKVLAEKDKESMIGDKVVVPHSSLQELLRILDHEEDEEVRIYVSENQIMFSTGDSELVSRVVSGQYPDYKQIIPTDFKTKAKVNVSEVLTAVKTASLFSQSGMNDVSLSLKPGKGVTVSSVNTQTGESTSDIKAEIEGEENGIVFNYRYVLDGLNALGGEEAIIEVVDNASPAVLHLADGSDYLYIIMPIKQ